MSAVRTRILFGDDTDLLAQARMAILSRADLDVVMAGTTEEALEIAAMNPRPRAAILPAKGEIDGVEVCRRLKSSSPDTMILLALAPGDLGSRDACFLAGADDIVFAPVDAADLVARIGAARGPAFRQAPRADVELALHLQGSATGPVIESRGLQISTDAIAVQLPNGVQPPPPGTLVRAIFTLYEGGTLTVWARFAPGDAGSAAVRLVGLHEQERRSIDYFVDFYRKGATARAAVEEVTNEVTLANPAASATPTATPAKTQSGLAVEDLKPTDQTLHELVNADLDAIASAAGLVTAGREGTAMPPAGFSVLRFRTLVPKLAPAEVSALRGTTMHNDILGDLRLCSGAKLRLFEMNSQIRSGAAGLSKIAAEQAVMAVIAEAQQIHKILEAALEARVKAGNTDAVRDLGPVNVGLVNACIDLKRTLDVEILKKAATNVAAAGAAPTQAKYDHAPKDDEASRPATAKPRQAPAGKGRRIALTLIIAGGLAAAIWQNYRLLNPPAAAPFTAPAFLWAAGDAHILQEATREKAMIFVVDGTWKAAPQKDRDAALAKMATRAALAGSSSASIVAVTGETLGTVPMASATAPVETATPSL